MIKRSNCLNPNHNGIFMSSKAAATKKRFSLATFVTFELTRGRGHVG